VLTDILLVVVVCLKRTEAWLVKEHMRAGHVETLSVAARCVRAQRGRDVHCWPSCQTLRVMSPRGACHIHSSHWTAVLCGLTAEDLAERREPCRLVLMLYSYLLVTELQWQDQLSDRVVCVCLNQNYWLLLEKHITVWKSCCQKWWHLF